MTDQNNFDYQSALEALLEKIKSYNSQDNLEIVEQAFTCAKEAHIEQKRATGEPYFIHPYEVAKIITELGLDNISVAAALLHDVIEDTPVTAAEIEKQFGTTVKAIVEGVTKLSKLPDMSSVEIQARNLRKMLLSMVKDIRVILVKLADRLHNIRTLGGLRVEKQKRISRETLEIYSPLAHRLGLYNIKCELEEKSFSYLEPSIYQNLSSQLDNYFTPRQKVIDEITADIQKECQGSDIQAKILSRRKHIFSVYKKLQRQDADLSQIYDLIGIRVLCNNVNDCYGVLGLIHKLYRPIPTRFKDFIALPKSNGYQSLQTTVICPSGDTVEIQIRTYAMDRINETGIAAHWLYKEDTSESYVSEMKWLRELVEWHREIIDDNQFMETVKIDLYQDEVFVFTPKGDVKVLTRGATPLDFAYAIHTEVGHRCVGSKVNGKIMPLGVELNNGDIVDILTSKTATPSRDWLNIVQSSSTRSKIKQYFKRQQRDEDIRRGRDDLIKELGVFGRELNEVPEDFSENFKIEADLLILANLQKEQRYSKALARLNFDSSEDCFAAVGRGDLSARNVINKVFPERLQMLALCKTTKKMKKQLAKKRKSSSQGVIVSGYGDVLVKFSRCCNPLPGDEIVGFVTRGKGVSIHSRNCNNASSSDPGLKSRQIEVHWDPEMVKRCRLTYNAQLKIEALDRPQLLLNITGLAANMKLNIQEMHARTARNNVGIVSFSVQVNNLGQLNDFIANLKKIEGVFRVTRQSQTTVS